ncbi:hypothetical protein FF125_20320 [Aureibaculum algae]|uniref:Uncharacterized protein n=1 Tax=Aureibaculum algae TaxID=2584122 RepID=A0A5B7TZC1_9FLAO|nr:hypothetical protein [Aureibaculum algae]QCX40671.1 hypothetical protein FF125_20320 [Aureibaculum algae]
MGKAKQIPDLLKERRSRRVLITIWFGLIPLIMGCFGLYNYFTKKEKIYNGSEFEIFYEENCGEEIKFTNCLSVIIPKDSLKTNLNKKQLNSYIKIYSKKTDVKIIKVVYVDSIIKELKINDQLIVTYKSALWWGILFTFIGLFWIIVHVRFFIKDPFNKYEELKDPFRKYKR